MKQALHSSSNFSLQISMNQLEAMEQSSYKFDSENLLWNRHKMSYFGLIVSRPLLLSKFTSVIGGRISNDNANGNFLKYSSSAEYVRKVSQSDHGNVLSQRAGVSQYIREVYEHKERKGHPQIAWKIEETVLIL